MKVDTERIVYRPGTVRTDFVVGAMNVHIFENTMGVQSSITIEHAVFLIDSPVTTTDIWEGEKQPQHRWEHGDLIFIPANTEVHAKYVSNPYSETMIRLPADVFEAAISKDIDVCSLDLRFIGIPSDRVYGMSRVVKQIALNPGAPQVLVEAATTALSASLACSLSKRAADVLRQPVQGLDCQRRQRVRAFIDENLAQPITLRAMADVAALSTHHFSRAFKKAEGVAPVRYLWGRRVDAAKRMLEQTDIPVGAVAMACGFASQSHLANAFKQATGMSPSEYRMARR